MNYRPTENQVVDRDPILPLRVAIVGMGPKGLYCLERLAAGLEGSNANRQVEVWAFEPHPTPGAGPVYDLNQSHCLRMNFASQKINAWIGNHSLIEQSAQLSLPHWLSKHYPNLENADSYVPRAIVGEYLNEVYHLVTSNLPANFRFTLSKTKVVGISKTAFGWKLTCGHDPSTELPTFDEVLLTTGHGGWRCGSVADAWFTSTELPRSKTVLCPFPTHEKLNSTAGSADSVVAIRGFALTAIDVILALTEGRGGTFQETASNRFNYLSSGDEPKTLIPYSRSGQPMHAKPDYRFLDLPQSLIRYIGEVWQAGRDAINSLHVSHGQLDWQQHIVPEIDRCMEQVYFLLSINSRNRHSFSNYIANDSRFSNNESTSDQVLQKMRHSVDVATGIQPIDAGWVVGEAWRQLYSALVNRISHHGLSSESISDFQGDARVLERIAFGPPAENLARIVALVEAGIVSLDYVEQPSIVVDGKRITLSAQKSTNAAPPIGLDTIINAVIPAPTIFKLDSLLGGALAKGYATGEAERGYKTSNHIRLRNGIRVSMDAGCLDENYKPINGLSVIGRATEGCILGNDTLSRVLHDHPSRWAKKVIQKLNQSDGVSKRTLQTVRQ